MKNDNKNIEDSDVLVVDNKTDNKDLASVDLQGLKVKKGGNIIIGTLNVVVKPAQKRWDKHYHPNKNTNWYWHLVIDFILAIIVLGLISLNIQFYIQNKSLIDYLPKQDKQNINNGVINAKLLLNITSGSTNINPGQTTEYTLNYKNDNDYTLENVEITVNIENILAQEKSLDWDKDNLPELAVIKPQTEGMINFSIATKLLEIQTVNGQGKLLSKIQATTIYDTINDQTTRGFSRSNQLIQKINTNLIIKASARYFTEEGDQLGSGPTPPVANIATKYWILLYAKNLYNPVNGFITTLQLADNVSWTGRISNTSASEVYYDQTNHRVIWTADTINPPTALSPDISIIFELEITPQEKQVGQVANLINNINTSAKDSFTGKTIAKNISAITTNLINDNSENSDGIVISR